MAVALQLGARAAPLSARRGAAPAARRVPAAAFAAAARPAARLKCVASLDAGAGASRAPRAVSRAPRAAASPNAATGRVTPPPALASGGGNGLPPARSSGGGGGGGGDDEEPAEDPATMIGLAEAERVAAECGVSLPADLTALAAEGGLRPGVLVAYIRYAQVGLLAALMGALPYVRDRMLADPRFLFKVGVEVGIDGFMACFAEARRVAHDFWSEAEFFVSDLLVGCVLDATLVTLLAAPAKLGAASPRAAALARGGRFAPLWAVAAELPASLAAAAPPGVRYTVAQRAFGFALKSLQFGAAGAACGLLGQAMANTAASARAAMRRKRDPQYAKDAHTLIMPPLLRTALVWGLFMGASAHTRLQAVVAIERIVESLPVSQRVAALPIAVSLVVRTANNIIGGEQFVDLARWAGVQ